MLAAIAAALLLAQPPSTAGAQHWPLVHLMDPPDRAPSRAVAVDPASGRLFEATPDPRRGEMSPDGRHMLFLAPSQKKNVSELMIADVADEARGRKVETRRVTTIKAPSGPALWLADSRHAVFRTALGDDQAVWLVDALAAAADPARDPPTPRRLSPVGATAAQASVSTGVAYLVRGRMDGKLYRQDVVYHPPHADGGLGEPVTLVRAEPILAVALSPAGDRLAWSIPGAIVITTIADGTERRLAYRDADDRFLAVGAYHLAWRPDGGAILADPRFLGGRLIMDGEEPEPLFADDKIVLFPLSGDAKPTLFSVWGFYSGLAWTEALPPDAPPAPNTRPARREMPPLPVPPGQRLEAPR